MIKVSIYFSSNHTENKNARKETPHFSDLHGEKEREETRRRKEKI
jgi:hypothetical protein